MSTPFFQLSSEALRLISFCPLCNTHHSSSKIQVLAEKGEAHLVHIRCQHCSSSVVSLVVTQKVGMSSIGLVTDLTPSDVLRFKDANEIDGDNVLEVHETLKNKNSKIF